MLNEKPLMIIRPNPGPVAVNLVYFIVVGLIFIAVPVIGLEEMSSTAGVFLMASGMFCIFSYFFVLIITVSRMKYLIYKNRVETYIDEIILINKKVVYFNEVTDIMLFQRFVDRIFGTGSIGINTAGKVKEMTFSGESSGYTMALDYLRNPKQIKDYIEKLVERGGGDYGY